MTPNYSEVVKWQSTQAVVLVSIDTDVTSGNKMSVANFSTSSHSVTVTANSVIDSASTEVRVYCDRTVARDVLWPRTPAGSTAVELCPNADHHDGSITCCQYL